MKYELKTAKNPEILEKLKKEKYHKVEKDRK